MNIDILIKKLLNYYNLKTLNDLADKLETTQSTISGWKSRNAIGALTDTVANKDPDALEYIFSNNSTIINQNNKSVKGKVREINVYLVFFGIFLNNGLINPFVSYLLELFQIHKLNIIALKLLHTLRE